MNEMKRDKLFGEVEIAALRLAAVRKDPTLTEALADYRDGDMGDTMFKATLLHVCERISKRRMPHYKLSWKPNNLH